MDTDALSSVADGCGVFVGHSADVGHDHCGATASHLHALHLPHDISVLPGS